MADSGRRAVLGLAALAVFRGFGVGGYQVLFSLYLAWLGYSMADIGSAITIAVAIAAVAGPGFGSLLDAFGSRAAVIYTAAMLSLGLGLPALGAYPALLASYTLFMLSFALGQPARTTLLYHSVPLERLGWYISLTSTGFAVARIGGSAAAGFVAEELGYEASFLILGSAVAAGSAVFTLVTRGITEPRRTQGGVLESIVGAYARALRPSRELATLYLMVSLDRIGWSLWFPMLTAMLYEKGFSAREAGMVMSVMNLVYAASSPLAGRAADHLHPALLLAASEAAGIAGLHALSYLDPYTAMALIGFSIALWVPAYNKLVALYARGRPGEAYATTNTVRMASGSLAPSIGGIIHDTLGAEAVYSASQALLAATAAIALATARYPRGGQWKE